MFNLFGKSKKDDALFNSEEFLPSLGQVVREKGLNPRKISVALPMEQDANRLVVQDRHIVLIADAKKFGEWTVPSLRECLRGNEKPPSLEQYPIPYCSYFYFIEMHVLNLCDGTHDRTDAEFEEWFRNLRRRPDGRSLGPEHDFLWQVMALLLAMKPLSPAQFEAILNRLANAAQTFQLSHSSRNYMGYLRQQFH